MKADRSTWRPRLVFFDLDDTLIHEDATDESLMVEVVRRNVTGPTWSTMEIVAAVRAAARTRWSQSGETDYCRRIQTSSIEGLYGDYSGSDPHLVALRSFIDATGYRDGVWIDALRALGVEDEALGRRLSVEYAVDRRSHHVPFPDARPTLERLAPKYRLGLITNGAPGNQRLKFEGSGLSYFFDPSLVFISGDFGIGKPDPAIFDLALRQAGVAADDALMIGNSLASDIAGARNAGIRAVWVDRLGDPLPSDVKPFQVVQSLDEVLPEG